MSTTLVVSPRRYPMPTDPGSMQPFLEGLNPSGRRMLVLLPRGEEEVGVILITTILSVERTDQALVFTVKKYRSEEMRVTQVLFGFENAEMYTGDGAPCYFVIDDSSGSHVPNMWDIFLHRFPGVWRATA